MALSSIMRSEAMTEPRKSSKPGTQKRRQVKKQGQEIRDIIESLSEMIFEADKVGNIVYANRITLDTLGYTKDDLAKGVNILDLVTKEDADKVKASLSRFLGGDHPQE